MKTKTTFIQKTLSFVLILLIGLPPANAASLLPILDNPKSMTAGNNVWDYLANKLYEGETDPAQLKEKDQLSSLLFADYLDYLNSVGIELAAYETSLQGKKEIKDSGECSDATLKSYNKLLVDSASSSLETFTNTYCESSCRQKAEFDFGLIANYAQSETGPKTCEEKAKEMYDSFNCNELGTNPDSSLADLSNSSFPSDLPVFSPRPVGGFNFGSDLSTDAILNSPRLPSFESSSSLLQSRSIDNFGLPASSRTPITRLPKLGTIDLTASKAADGDFKTLLSTKKTACKKAVNERVRQTFGEPGVKSTPIGSIRNPLDPRWTSMSPNDESTKRDDLANKGKNPACSISQMDTANHYAKLRSGYMRISLQRISSSFSRWPIYDDNDNIEKDYLRLITLTSDQLFLPLIADLEAKYNRVCNGGGANSKIAETVDSGVPIAGRKYDVIIKESNPPKTEEQETETPETVATHFNSSSSAVQSFIDGMLGSPQTGAGTHTEIRAGEIAKGVKDGEISQDEIGTEAMKGPFGLNSKEIEAKTREYLSQGDYQGIKVFAAELAGGIVTGGILTGGLKKAAGAVLAEGGSLSKLLIASKEFTLGSYGLGREAGSINIGVKVLQTGGRTFENRTAQELNKFFGKNMNKNEWGKCLERLKKDFGIANNHHGRILSNGDYLDMTGRTIGNIKDYFF